MAASHVCSVHGYVFVLALIAAPQPAPASFPYQDLAPEFVEKIAAAVAPLQQVRLVAAREADSPGGPAAPGTDDTRARQWETYIAEMLAARGLRAIDRPDGAATVAFICSQNLRERV